MTHDALPGGPRADALADELDQLAQRAGRFLSRLKADVDDVEVWLRRTDVRGWRLDGHDLEPLAPPTEDRVGFRVFRGGTMGVAATDRVDESAWQACVRAALAAAGPISAPRPQKPAARRPGPMTFDPDLADELASGRTLGRLAEALGDNTWHEASRMPGLASLTGRVQHTVRRYLVGNRAGVLASLHGALSARIELNGVYGDVFHQTHAPESYLPLALLGARTWRTMPRAHATPADVGFRGRVPVMLHPRLLERLLRALGPRLLSADARDAGRVAFEEGDTIAAPTVTLVDDPGMDGLASSRAFDDEGIPTRRIPLIVRGRLTQVLRSREDAERFGGQPTGSAWRRVEPGPEGALRPAELAFGSLVMERGELGFHDLVAQVDKAILVQEVDDLDDVDAETGRFSCRVRWGVTLEPGAESRLLARGAWRIQGHLFARPGGAPGLLDDVSFSRELYDTGTGILPYALGVLEV